MRKSKNSEPLSDILETSYRSTSVSNFLSTIHLHLQNQSDSEYFKICIFTIFHFRLIRKINLRHRVFSQNDLYKNEIPLK